MDVGYMKKILTIDSMKKVVFFSYAHRGDIFLSRSFVQHIMECIDADFYYAHYWGEYLLKDLNLTYISLDEIPKIQQNNEHASNFVKDDIVYINTWIGKYASEVTPGYCECTLHTLYSLVYPKVFAFLSKNFNINLELKDISEYLGCEVDFSVFNIDSVNKFIEEEQGRKILFCNGPSLSNQCSYDGDLQEVIENVSRQYSDVCFITTQNIQSSFKNIKYSGDIIGNQSQDLYEISYLSKFCDLIIGRYSGPFIWTNAIKDNIFNENKKFLCFGDKATDCHPYNMKFDSEFVFENFTNLEDLEKTIVSMI